MKSSRSKFYLISLIMLSQLASCGISEHHGNNGLSNNSQSSTGNSSIKVSGVESSDDGEDIKDEYDKVAFDLSQTEAIEDLSNLDKCECQLMITNEGKTRFEMELANLDNYVISSANPSKIVEREDASNGKFIVAATGAIASGKYLEFYVYFEFNAEIQIIGSYSQPEKYKNNAMDMSESMNI